jgi:2-oxo-4-hydroxy-4-carboxy--5-ureidoimidazoline (OHCU) decarboxylase
MDELSRLNLEYEQKFGFIYIVCATGKSAEEMLAILRDRLSNNRDEELRNAAAEQTKITALRLNKLLEVP